MTSPLVTHCNFYCALEQLLIFDLCTLDDYLAFILAQWEPLELQQCIELWKINLFAWLTFHTRLLYLKFCLTQLIKPH